LKRGEWSEFYENGQIFKKDFYNENGKLSGPFEYYFEDGQTFQKGNYLNGNLDGWWEEHYKGGIPREIEYKNLYKDGEVIQYTEQF
jgi:antitoxin component YwqK of YwqJK toxin-antitoxin module